ncbi:hypothetical protein FALBO_1450 [Fusarium albosuccineum]|uniref:Uncharacterized protein n=1 Tax=Fusarium albosuccineum TaxID=1237068 RepID=A0A8H4PGA4_9HYPO|nr:hypothetical protein FALBO_1450 [Fusarium albosuccineum]
MADHNNSQVDYGTYTCPVCFRSLSWHQQHPYCSEHGYLYSQPLASLGQDGTLQYHYADNQTYGPQGYYRNNFGVVGRDDVEENHAQNAHQDDDDTTAHERLSTHIGGAAHDDAEDTTPTGPPSEVECIAGSWPRYVMFLILEDVDADQLSLNQYPAEDMFDPFLETRNWLGTGDRDTSAADDAVNFFPNDDGHWSTGHSQSYSSELYLSDEEEEAPDYQAPQ